MNEKSSNSSNENYSPGAQDFVASMADAPSFYGREQTAAPSDLCTEKLAPNQPFEIPPDSKVPKDLALDGVNEFLDLDDHREFMIEPRALEVSEYCDIAAVILAYDQPFWLLDFKDQASAKKGVSSYMLYSPVYSMSQIGPADSQSNKIAIRNDDREVFGRVHRHGSRFSYSPQVSRDHFEIQCNDGNIDVTDLGSKNGTTVIFTSTAEARSEEKEESPAQLEIERIPKIWLSEEDIRDAMANHTKRHNNGRLFGYISPEDSSIVAYPNMEMVEWLFRANKEPSFKIGDLTLQSSSSFKTKYGKAVLIYSQNGEDKPHMHFCVEDEEKDWYEITTYYTDSLSHPEIERVSINDKNKLPDEIARAIDENAPYGLSDLFTDTLLLNSTAIPHSYKNGAAFLNRGNYGATNWFTGELRPEDRSLVDMLSAGA